MTVKPQDDLTAERAAAIFNQLTINNSDRAYHDIISDLRLLERGLRTARQEALREIRQVCVDYEDCCVLGLVAHGDKAVTNASIGAIQFIRRHIDDRLASEGG